MSADAELIRSGQGPGPFGVRDVKLNGQRVPNVMKATVVATPHDVCILHLEIKLTSVKDVFEDPPQEVV